MVIFETLLKVPTLVQVFGISFFVCILIAAVEIGYRTEQIGDEEE